MKQGVGLYQQLKPEYMKRIHNLWEKRMAMSDEEKIQEYYTTAKRGLALLQQVLIKRQQDANIKYITN